MFVEHEQFGERYSIERYMMEQDHSLESRYVAAGLPTLPFDEGEFDLALCSHVLFLYSEQLSEQFHVEAVRDLVRVAKQVRIFPVTDLAARPSCHVESVRAALDECGCQVVIESVDYEFQRGANQMMRILPRP